MESLASLSTLALAAFAIAASAGDVKEAPGLLRERQDIPANFTSTPGELTYFTPLSRCSQHG
jgi:hypothetical protein